MDTQSLHSKASQDTLVSLLQLDPLPIESPSSNPNLNTDKDLPPLPEASADAEASDGSVSSSHPTTTTTTTTMASGTSSSIGLSGSGHSAIYYLTRIQRYSSYTFSFFASLHLATTSIIPLAARSVPASESYLLLAREIYQTSLSEPLLIGIPIVTHVGSGIAIRLLRRGHNLRRYGREKGPRHGHGQKSSLSISSLGINSGWPNLSYIALSGYGFTAVLAAHIFMNRALPLAVEGDSANIGLAYVAHGFARHGWISWAAYVALLGLGCGHMVWGWAKWFGLAQGAGWKLERPTGNLTVDKRTRKKRRRMLMGINAGAVAAAGVWAAGGLWVVARGGETPGWVGKLYDGLYAKIPGF
ncbi:hypothetical protein B0H66DRAFT_598774 [Apodospora peruviana]|uniref:Mitochondrial adapter protein MCP1 transmembrane domain-containing protein n=1 Tax=Apodospora peruviana TaxID=516989 RepID=A0AAE0IUB0_9PEZI|nr:hypothetical protein B0H66DRAFT_598774 [Apodospora peruviana]